MLTYVAAPYSNQQNKDSLMEDIAEFCAVYMKNHPGEYAVTGLVHHYACQYDKTLGTDWNFWKDFCTEFISKCNKLVVIKFPGWHESKGVLREIEIASEMGISVEFYESTYNPILKDYK